MIKLEDALAKLAAELGTEYEPGLDDHGRFRLYRQAVRTRKGLSQLRAAIGLEPDVALALSEVATVLEFIDPAEHAEWIEQVPPEYRDYPQRRSDELAILRAATAGSPTEPDLDSWSDWLQLRLADHAEDPDLLARLATSGRTRRTRHHASERLNRDHG
ncbi:hypothetical protein D5S17_32340 [Pseudonocardiaceae bacterium YIM PH 21723]|nr:hypothetical protein D5S17_32340 [Pseudonocardiaceae bacterium YIM PH 21723]